MKLKRDTMVTYKIPRSIKEKFDEIAWKQRRSSNDLINHLIEQCIKKN